MLQRIRLLLGMIRFSHTLFALPFALTSAVLAWNRGPGFRWLHLVGIILCMVFARSAAMAFNRLADREHDAKNPRTGGRHLPAGLLGVGEVWVFLVVCSVGFIASTLLFWTVFGNLWPLYLAIPVLLFLLGYSLTKRVTALSHFWLGTSLLLAPLAAWIAIRGVVSLSDLWTPLILGGAVLFWVAGFDILYACQDVDYDRQAGLHSVPARLGIRRSLLMAMGCHAIMVLLLVALYFVASPPLGRIYLGGTAGCACLLVYEHSLVKPSDLSRVNQAFFNVNGIISVGLFLVVLVQVAV